MSEIIQAFGEELEIEICPNCKGTGHSQEWNRKQMKHVLNKSFPCERCKGARFIVVSHWKREETT
jgi:DnaJ-class molecular chaperone